MTDDDRKKLAAERIRALRDSLGMDQPEFAGFLGLPKDGQSYISKWEKGKSTPSAKFASLLSIKGGMDPVYYQGLEPVAVVNAATVRTAKIVGEVQAGAWHEAIEFAPDDQIDIAIPSNVPNFDVDAFVVKGPSMDKVFPEGTIVLIASTIKNRIQLRSGDYVLVQRTDANGLHEASLKQLIEDPEGRRWLWPQSNDPMFQQPLSVTEGDDAIITGRVMGATLAFPLAKRK